MAILIKAIAFLLSKLPLFTLGKICQSLGALMIWLPLKRKRVLLSNLVHAFPFWSKAKLNSVARESAARMFEMGFFSIIYPYFNKAKRWRTVFYDQQTLRELDDLRKNDVPVLFLVPHVSLFETLATSPCFRPNKGKSLGAVYRPNRNPKLDDWITEARLSTGMKLFSRKAGLKKALYFLRDGNWLTVLFDQNGGHAGSDAMFLKRLTSVTTFPDLLAKVNNLRVVYALPRRIGFLRRVYLSRKYSQARISQFLSRLMICWQVILRTAIELCQNGFGLMGSGKFIIIQKSGFNLIKRGAFCLKMSQSGPVPVL